jgi:hypothetical protein
MFQCARANPPFPFQSTSFWARGKRDKSTGLSHASGLRIHGPSILEDSKILALRNAAKACIADWQLGDAAASETFSDTKM